MFLAIIKKMFVIAVICAVTVGPSLAATIYFAPTATGSGNGSSCSNAYAWTDSTHGITGASASWSAGNTLYVCQGIYPCSAVGGVGSNGITAAGGGSAGNLILLQFDTTGPVNLTCGAWGNAINLSGYDYIVADGASSAGGVIQNTANGSTLTYQDQSTGIESTGTCNNQEIRNFNIVNMYVYSDPADESAGHSTADISTAGCDAMSLHGNTLNWAKTGISFNYTTITSLNIYNNAIDYVLWSVYINDEPGSSLTSANIYGNSMGPHRAVWDDNGFNQHGDGIFFYAQYGTYSGVNIFNNYLFGDFTAYGTGYITLGGDSSGVTIFNNAIVQTVDQCGSPHLCGPQGLISAGQSGSGATGPYAASNLSIYNNTFIGNSAGDTGSRHLCGLWLDDTTWSGTNKFENNIVDNLTTAICTNLSSLVLQVSNGNDFYDDPNLVVENVDTPTTYTTLPAWQAVTLPTSGNHPDLGSSVGNPNINSTAPPYYITSGSAAQGLGINLTSLGITALNFDAPYTFGPSYACGSGCTARPSSSAWNAGAYQINGSPPPPPPAVSTICPQCFAEMSPTDLTAQVQ